MHRRQAAELKAKSEPKGFISLERIAELRFQYKSVIDLATVNWQSLANKELEEASEGSALAAENAAHQAQAAGEDEAGKRRRVETPVVSDNAAAASDWDAVDWSGRTDSETTHQPVEKGNKIGAEMRGEHQEEMKMEVTEAGEERPKGAASAAVDKDRAPPRRQSHADEQEATEANQWTTFLNIAQECTDQLPDNAHVVRTALTALASARQYGPPREDSLDLARNSDVQSHDGTQPVTRATCRMPCPLDFPTFRGVPVVMNASSGQRFCADGLVLVLVVLLF